MEYLEGVREYIKKGGRQGWLCGESARLPPTNVARVQIPAWTLYVGVAFVDAYLPYSEKFFSGCFGFCPLLKNQHLQIQFQESGRRRTT